MKTYKQFTEALKLSDYKNFRSDLGLGKAPKREVLETVEWAMDKLATIPSATRSRNGHRIYLPLKDVAINPKDISPSFDRALAELTGKLGYSDPNILAGTIKEPKHGRAVKFSNAFRDLSDRALAQRALAEYGASPVRYSASLEGMLVFTAHPYDKLGGSTNRDWTSCTDLKSTGPNWETLHKLMDGSNIMVYYTDVGDKNLNAPKGRSVLSVFEDENAERLLWTEDRLYGNFPIVALDFLQDKLLKLFPQINPVWYPAKLRTDSAYDSYSDKSGVVKRNYFVVMEPFDWKGASKELRNYVEKKYEVSFDEQGKVTNRSFSFPLRGEPYFSDKLPFELADSVKYVYIENCSITDFKGLPESIETLRISNNKKLVDLKLHGTVESLVLKHLPNLVRIAAGAFKINEIKIYNASNLDFSACGEFSELYNATIDMGKGTKTSPFLLRAPALELLDIVFDDLDLFLRTVPNSGHLTNLFPGLKRVYLTDRGARLDHVPDFLFPTKYMLYVDTDSLLGKLIKELYGSEWNMVRALSNKAITKDAIYWDMLPDKWDGYKLIPRPDTDTFHDKRII